MVDVFFVGVADLAGRGGGDVAVMKSVPYR